MAIQLSERDNLIFKFIEEHQVLLEKHIAWFISCDDKPVLIRDRLRKLFYLDYLLCERHGGKLPWWTTPTKPLVYMLSPMTRQLVRASDSEVDLSDCETQRHLLEIANLRMLFLVDQKEALIGDVNWKTIHKAQICETELDSTVAFSRNGSTHKVGIINHPTTDAAKLRAVCENAITSGACEVIWIISRDDAHQQAVQQALSGQSVAARCAFATHQELYKSGIAKAKWQGVDQKFASVFTEAIVEAGSESVAWGGRLSPIQAFS